MDGQVVGRKWSKWIADSVIAKFPHLTQKWSYDYGVILKGIEMVYNSTLDEKYFDYIKSTMDFFVDNSGQIKFYDIEKYNLDYINNGKILMYLYKKTGDKKYKYAIDTLRKQLYNQPRTSEGGFWHKKIYPYQMWLDGIYMAEPFYAEYINNFEDKDYSDIVKQFVLIKTHCRDSKTKLLYHGYDETKSSIWADNKTGVSANFWGRSVGWYCLGLVDSLDYIDKKRDRDILIDVIRDLAEGLVDVQSDKNGVWYQVLDKANEYGNYVESSCSCMFVYFLLKSIRKGYIDKSYFKYAKKGFYGIVREFVEVGEDGLINLKNTVYAGGLGGDLFRDGSYEYYISEPKQVNSLLGLGAFIMASAELEVAKL